jgi:hypothetical protein
MQLDTDHDLCRQALARQVLEERERRGLRVWQQSGASYVAGPDRRRIFSRTSSRPLSLAMFPLRTGKLAPICENIAGTVHRRCGTFEGDRAARRGIRGGRSDDPPGTAPAA